MFLAADEQDGNGLQFENFTLNFSSCFRAIQESIFYFLFEDVFFYLSLDTVLHGLLWLLLMLG